MAANPDDNDRKTVPVLSLLDAVSRTKREL